MTVRILVGDVRERIAGLPDNSVQCVVTSPRGKISGTAQVLEALTPPLTARSGVGRGGLIPIMPKRKLPPNDDVIAMYRSGMSCGEIAEQCSVKPVTVDSLLRRIGESLRSPAEAARIRSERGRANTPKYWLGKKQPPDMVERRVSKIRGEQHYLWKGGNSKRDYRGVVDKDACARCGSRQNLSIHHIDLDHYNNDPENLEVLCASCHMSLHKQAYWDAVHAGEATPKSNGPVGWIKKGGG